jgi:V/A-type H+-transporting ATPase subunit F
MELAAVGRDDFVQGFKLAGVRKTVSVNREGLEAQVAKILEDPNVGILILSADEMSALSNTMRRKLETTPRPVVIAVGKTEEEDLRAKIKRAIGVDLYK